MKLYKISQNIDYLNKIGVPYEFQQEILDYLMSLDGDTRKTVLRKIRKNPAVDLAQVKELETDTKKDYLRGQGYPEEVVDYATQLSPKYAVWIAREIKNQFTLPKNQEIAQKSIGTQMVHSFASTFGYCVNETIDWIKQTNPNLMEFNIIEASDEAEKWHEELKNQEVDSEYVSHNTVFKLPDGWEIVKLDSGDCETEGDLMGHCCKGYADDVAQGRTEIYSLRDPKNNPHATIEMNTYQRSKPETTYDFSGIIKPTYGIEVVQIQGKGNEEPIPEYKEMIKTWFNGLKQQGYEFDAIDDYGSDNTAVKDLGEALGREDDYGVPIAMGGIGGDEITYNQNLRDAYNEGYSGSYWYERTALEIIDNLVTYAEQNKELDKIEKARNMFDEWAFYAWIEAENYIEFENPRPDEDEDYPNKENFMIQPDIKEQQLEFKGMPTPQPVFNEQAYNEALKEYQAKEQAYENELAEHQKYFEPYIFSNHLYEKIEEAKQREIAKEKGNIEQEQPVMASKASKMKTKIYKMSDITNTIKDKDIPKPDILATYIEALKTYLTDATTISKTIKEQIENLPAPAQVKKAYSFEECKILFETVNYLWKKITKTDIVQDPSIEPSPETLLGNYWMLKNGVLLRGNNHTSIIKQNSSLFCSLLNLNAFTLLQYLSTDPNKLIFYVLRNGGVRIFINKDRKAYFQMSEQIYSKWGRKRVKELDFDKKTVKILDFNQDYNGWGSGIAIKL